MAEHPFRKKLRVIWSNMMARCYLNSPNFPTYEKYGGRGIRVCDEWHIFDNFLKDMGGTYSEGLSLDRINVHDNYYKGNCQWATKKEQGFNKTNTIYLTINGVTKRIGEWAKETDVSIATMKSGFHRGYPHYEVVFGKLQKGFTTSPRSTKNQYWKNAKKEYDIKGLAHPDNLLIPIYPSWVEFKGETFVAQLNFERTEKSRVPMFDLSYCMTKALNQVIIKTVRYDKSLFKVSPLETNKINKLGLYRSHKPKTTTP